MSEWKTIYSAPKDGTHILAYCRHDADPHTEDDGQTITGYACACEAFTHADDGIHVVCMEPAQQEGSYEEGYYTIPEYWALAASEGETPCFPTHWMPLPQIPEDM